MSGVVGGSWRKYFSPTRLWFSHYDLFGFRNKKNLNEITNKRPARAMTGTTTVIRYSDDFSVVESSSWRQVDANTECRVSSVGLFRVTRNDERLWRFAFVLSVVFSKSGFVHRRRRLVTGWKSMSSRRRPTTSWPPQITSTIPRS